MLEQLRQSQDGDYPKYFDHEFEDNYYNDDKLNFNQNKKYVKNKAQSLNLKELALLKLLSVYKNNENSKKLISNIRKQEKLLELSSSRTLFKSLSHHISPQKTNLDGEFLATNFNHKQHASPSFYMKNNKNQIIDLVHKIEHTNTNKNHNNNNNKVQLSNSREAIRPHTTKTTHTSFYQVSKNLPVTSIASLNDYPSSIHKSNEFYSIFISMLTAAIFLLFIMWRWIKMKSDLRKALREQLEIQQQEQTNNRSLGDTASNGISITLPMRPTLRQYSLFLSNNREELQATVTHLINRLSNGEYTTLRQHQQMINTAKYCLQQLKLHARITQQQLEQHSQCRYGSNSNSAANSPATLSSDNFFNYPLPTTSVASRISNSSLPSIQSGPDSNSNSFSSIHTLIYTNLNLNGNYQKRGVLIEPPPAYDSLLTKSSSLPSYCNFISLSESDIQEK